MISSWELWTVKSEAKLSDDPKLLKKRNLSSLSVTSHYLCITVTPTSAVCRFFFAYLGQKYMRQETSQLAQWLDFLGRLGQATYILRGISCPPLQSHVFPHTLDPFQTWVLGKIWEPTGVPGEEGGQSLDEEYGWDRTQHTALPAPFNRLLNHIPILQNQNFRRLCPGTCTFQGSPNWFL